MDLKKEKGRKYRGKQPDTRGKGFQRRGRRRQDGSSRSSSASRSVCDDEDAFEFVSLPPDTNLNEGVVGVFWDIENCPVPRNVSARTVAKKIRDHFYQGRREELFVAACDVKNQGVRVSKQLVESQVTVMHVDSSMKNAADQTLKVHLGRFAEVAKKVKGSSVVLVSGDCDFAAQMHDLRYRHGVHVVLLHPPKVRDELLDVANQSLPFREFVSGATQPVAAQVRVENLPTHRDEKEMQSMLKILVKNDLAVIGCMEKNGSCVMTFPNEASAEMAAEAVNGVNLFGNVLAVKPLNEQQQKKKSLTQIEVVLEHLPKMKKHQLDQELKQIIAEFSGKVGRFLDNTCTLYFADRSGADAAMEKLRAWQHGKSSRSFEPVTSRAAAEPPIFKRRSLIAHRVKRNPVCAVVADSGYGKSTYVPYFLSSDLPADGTIICTHTFKLAAVRHAINASHLMNCRIGTEVAFEIDNTPPVVGKPKIVYTTDYCMLEKCVLDPELSAVSCVVVDDIQDRTTFTDILLGFLYRLIKKRTDLRIVLLSSDVQSAKSVFTLFGLGDRETLLNFSGLSSEVEMSWQDVGTTKANFVDKAVAVALKISSDVGCPGNTLVFLATQSDTHRACEMVKKKVNSDQVEVLAFHNRLSPKDQQKLFSHSDRRKVIFADAIAENALSVAGVRYVVDSGWKQDCRTTLPSRISKAMADCRRSRAVNGVCYRLYTQEEYQTMENVSEPEILTAGLSHACLKLTQLGVKNPCLFDFPDPPPKAALFSDLKTLVSLGAIKNNRLSQLGTLMSSFPLDPHLAKMVVKAADVYVQYEAIVIAAMTSLSSSGVQFFTGSTCPLAENNDFLTFFRVFEEWSKILHEKKKEWCRAQKVNNRAMKMANDLIGDLLFILKKKTRTIIRQKNETLREETRLLICTLILEIFVENICVSLGHTSEGYAVASANPARRQDRLFLRPSSFMSETPSVVLYDNSVRAEDKDLMLHVMQVSEELLTCAFDKGLVKQDCFERVKEQMLVTMTFGPYGQRVLNMFAGKNVESKLRGLLDSHRLSISFSPKDGLVTVQCSAKDKQKVLDHLTSDLQDIVSQLEAERAPLGHSSTFEYGCGAQVVPTSDPVQYETVRVVAVPETIVSAVVLNDLRSFGTILHYTEEEKDDVKELIVTFSNPGEARDAVHKMAASRPYRVVPETASTLVSRFEAELTWMRRPCTGSARLFFAAVEDLVWAGEHLCRTTFFQKITLSINKTTYADILMEGLPWDASSQLVLDTLSKILAENDFGRRDLTPERVEVTRDPEYVSTPEECASKKSSLQNLFSVFVQKGEMRVQVFQPESTQLHWKCLVSFGNSADWKVVVEKVNLGIAFPGSDVLLKVKSECTQRSSLGCHHKKVVRLLRPELDKLLARRQCSLEVTPLVDPNTTVRLELKAAGEGDVSTDVRQQACELLKGEVFTARHFDEIRALKSLKPHLRIMVDELKEEVRVHGTETQRNETKATIEKSLHSFMTKSLPLPKGLLKEAKSTYGNDLDSLRQACGLHFLRLRLLPDARHLLDACGSLAALLQLETVIGQLSSQPGEANSDLLCSLCSGPLDADSAYRLQVCGHPYCISCIPLLVKNSSIPLVCLVQNCGKLLVLEDFRQQAVQERALATFVRSHLDEYRFCPLPYCKAIYRPKEFHRKRNCKACCNDFCLLCDEMYLEGHSCGRVVSEEKKSSSLEDVTKCHSCGFPLVESDHCLDSIRFCLICDAPC